MSASALAGPLLLVLLPNAPARPAAVRGSATPSPAPHAQEEAREAPASEGGLNNDVFVPGADAAAAALASGDKALQQARAEAAGGSSADAERQLDVAFDHWRNALAAGGPGAATWIAAAENEEQRLSEGVHAGVVRRLFALETDERARWSARHAPAAELALAALLEAAPAQRTAHLSEVARLFPLTPSGARAALELGDLALEAGLHASARGWYARARREARSIGAGALLAALEVRAARLPARRTETVEAWQRAQGCQLVDSFSWSDPGRSSQRSSAADEDSSLRPGGCFVGVGHFAIQTSVELLLVALDAGGELELVERRPLAELLGGYAPGAFEAPREAPGWPLLPISDEHGLVAVAGRTDEGEPNALVAVALELEQVPELDLGLQLGAAAAVTRLAWAIVGSERIDAGGSSTILELEDLGLYEVQPGPVVSGDRVVVQARQYDGQVRSHLLAFDRRDGALVWKRQLAAGADRVVTPRFGQTIKRLAGQPLLALELEGEGEALVFAGTHLGLGGLVDSLAGEPLWSFKNRRRDPRAPGWSGARPFLGAGPDGTDVVLWTPADSDRLYCLVPRALAGARAAPEDVLASPPEPLAEAQALLGGDAEEQLVLGRTGRTRAVSARRAGRDRIDALELGQDERFTGAGAVSGERAWIASNRGLFLLDRTRELYRLDHEALPSSGYAGGGGDVHARGERVLVLGSGTLWSFRVR